MNYQPWRAANRTQSGPIGGGYRSHFASHIQFLPGLISRNRNARLQER